MSDLAPPTLEDFGWSGGKRTPLRKFIDALPVGVPTRVPDDLVPAKNGRVRVATTGANAGFTGRFKTLDREDGVWVLVLPEADAQ